MTQKITGITRYLAVFVIIGLFSLPALAQISLPDYSKWEVSNSSINVILNGKAMSLKFDLYRNMDDKVINLFVNVVSNDKGEPWLAFHVLSYKNQSKPNEFHFFEYKNGKWEYVKNFSDSQDLRQDSDKFLKERYNLIW